MTSDSFVKRLYVRLSFLGCLAVAGCAQRWAQPVIWEGHVVRVVDEPGEHYTINGGLTWLTRVEVALPAADARRRARIVRVMVFGGNSDRAWGRPGDRIVLVVRGGLPLDGVLWPDQVVAHRIVPIPASTPL